jgi:predicted transcriptional regulator YdeE
MAYNEYTASAQEIEKAHEMIDNLDPVKIDESTWVRFTSSGVQVEVGDKVHCWQLVYSTSFQFDGSALDQNSGVK